MGNSKTDSSCESESETSSDSSGDSKRLKKEMKKLKKKIKKEEKKKEKRLRKKIKSEKKKLKKHKKLQCKDKDEKIEALPSEENTNENSNNVPIGLMERSKAMAPMTKEEWEKRQSVVRRVLDEESGRYRLIKGDGEVLEEIVSQKRHKEINKQATLADGAFFQAKTVQK